MNKKLINLAVAAALAAPAAAMAEATLYGVLHQSIDYIDQDDLVVLVPDPNTPPGQPPRLVEEVVEDGFDGWSINRADGNILGSTNVLSLLPDGTVERIVGSRIQSLPPGSLPPGVDPAELQDAAVDLLETYYGGIRLTNRPVGPSNRIGVKGSEDLGNGLKGVYQVEFGVRLSDGDFSAVNGDRGSVSMRNSFVGLGGDFGTFLIGRHDSPLKISTAKLDLFADTMADYNGALGFEDLRLDNAVAYISPSWSGFQFAGAVHAGGGATVEGQRSIESDSLAEGYSLAAIYSNGPWYASAAYESLDSDLSAFGTDFDEAILDFDETYGTNLAGRVLSEVEPVDDSTKWRVGLGILDWNGFSLTGIYEDRSDTAFVGGLDTESWQIQAGYAFGNSMIKAAYGQQDRDINVLGADAVKDEAAILGVDLDAGDLEQWTVAFDYNFSKRTKAYVLYNNVDDDYLPDWDGFSLGVVHKF